MAFYQLTVEHVLPQIPPPSITLTDWMIDAGSISFTLVGQGGGSYFIETSTNLTHWSFLLVTNSISGRVGFTDTLKPGVRFYRGGAL